MPAVGGKAQEARGTMLTTGEAGRRLGFTPKGVRDLLESGEFPNAWQSSDNGGAWRIPESDVDDYLARRIEARRKSLVDKRVIKRRRKAV